MKYITNMLLSCMHIVNEVAEGFPVIHKMVGDSYYCKRHKTYETILRIGIPYPASTESKEKEIGN